MCMNVKIVMYFLQCRKVLKNSILCNVRFVTTSANVVIRLFDFGFSDFDCFSAIEALNLHFVSLSFFAAGRSSPKLAIRILYLFALSAFTTNYHFLILTYLHKIYKCISQRIDRLLKARRLWNALHLRLNLKADYSRSLALILDKPAHTPSVTCIQMKNCSKQASITLCK